MIIGSLRVFVKIIGQFQEYGEETMCYVQVVDLQRNVDDTLEVSTVLWTVFADEYPNYSYIGKCFMIERKILDNRSCVYAVTQIEKVTK